MVRYTDLTNSSVNYGRDVRQRIINVDADYRESPTVQSRTPAFGGTLITGDQNSPTDFLFKLTTPVRNVGGFKVTSIEIDSGVTFGSSYALLQVNEESSIESRSGGGRELRSVAKIPAVTPDPTSGYILLTDSTGLISSPVTFRNPQDVAVLRVRLVNPDGTTLVNAKTNTPAVDTPGTNEIYASKVSFTLELDEVTNAYLYESQRKHIGYDPANALK